MIYINSTLFLKYFVSPSFPTKGKHYITVPRLQRGTNTTLHPCLSLLSLPFVCNEGQAHTLTLTHTAHPCLSFATKGTHYTLHTTVLSFVSNEGQTNSSFPTRAKLTLFLVYNEEQTLSLPFVSNERQAPPYCTTNTSNEGQKESNKIYLNNS